MLYTIDFDEDFIYEIGITISLVFFTQPGSKFRFEFITPQSNDRFGAIPVLP